MRFIRNTRSCVLGALAVIMALSDGATAQVGSADIGRETLRLLREQRIGESALRPRRQQSKGAPKRIWQIEQSAQDAQDQEAAQAPPAAEPTQTPPQAAAGADKGAISQPAPRVVVEPGPVALSAGRDVLNLVPADALFCVRIRNMQAAMDQLDRYLAGVSETPVSVSAMVQGLLAVALGDAELKNVNLQGQMALFGVTAQADAGQAPMPQMAMLLPVSDYDAFVAGHPAIGPPNSLGVSTIQVQDSPLGELVCMASPDPHWALLTAREAQTRLDAVKAHMQAAPDRLAARLPAQEASLAATAPVWAHVDAGAAAQMSRALAQGGAGQGAAAMGGINPQQMLGQTEELAALLEQMEWITLAAEPSEALLRLNVHTRFVAGSDLAGKVNKRFFTAPPAPDAPVLVQQLGTLLQHMRTAAQNDPAVRSLTSRDKADFVGAFNPIELAGMALAIAMMQEGQDSQQAMAPAMMAMMLTQMGQQVKTKMAVAITVDERDLAAELVVPKAHLIELAQLGAKMQESMGGAAAGSGSQSHDQGELSMTFPMQITPADEVTVVVLGPIDGNREDEICDDLIELTGSQDWSLSSMRSGDKLTVTVGPVTDVKAYADKITFGTVTQVQDRTITVQVR